MFIIPGRRRGSKVLFYKGFTYARDVQSTKIFRCSKSKSSCDAYLYFKKDIGDIKECVDENLKENKDYEIKNRHLHLPDPYKAQWTVLLNIMKKRARETNNGLKEFFMRFVDRK